MTTSNPTWAVVATVDEHPAVLRTFVAWHLQLGAHAVHLYFDRPDDPAAVQFAEVDRVHLQLCDAAHWAALQVKRPHRHQIRQLRNATDAYAKTDADWLLHIDADEFLWPELQVSDHLDAVYPWIDGAVVPVAERIFMQRDMPSHVYGGAFRRPRPGQSEAGSPTLRGLTGHAIGKAFTRTGQDLTISIHRPQRSDPAPKIAHLDRIELLHFDGMTRLHWISKLLRKADAFANHKGMPPSSHRQMQIDAVLADVAGAGALHDSLKVFSAGDLMGLKAEGLLLEVAFDPTAALKVVFNDTDLLKQQAFDDWLRAEKTGVLPLLQDVK